MIDLKFCLSSRSNASSASLQLTICICLDIVVLPHNAGPAINIRRAQCGLVDLLPHTPIGLNCCLVVSLLRIPIHNQGEFFFLRLNIWMDCTSSVESSQTIKKKVFFCPMPPSWTSNVSNANKFYFTRFSYSAVPEYPKTAKKKRGFFLCCHLFFFEPRYLFYKIFENTTNPFLS